MTIKKSFSKVVYPDNLYPGGQLGKKDTSFDILILTQHWPYTTCRDWEERSTHNTCTHLGTCY